MNAHKFFLLWKVCKICLQNFYLYTKISFSEQHLVKKINICKITLKKRPVTDFLNFLCNFASIYIKQYGCFQLVEETLVNEEPMNNFISLK